jgi:hypothetical protein
MVFRNTYQQRQSFIEGGHFGCFDVSIIRWDRGGEYGLEGNIWVMAQHEKPERSSLGLVRCSNSSTFIFERTSFDLHFCVKDQDFLNPSFESYTKCHGYLVSPILNVLLNTNY